MRPAPGEIIGGKYRIVRLIGDGGMGAVYEAYHEFLQTNVALKFLHAELAKRTGLASRFLQEARVSARIRSVHVTHVTDVDQTPDGSPYLVMELLQGESLQQAMDRRRGKLPPDQAIDFALQILSGLESAHAIGVVHRDLKPDNVFIVPAAGGPLLKLIDFGIAKLRASTEFKGLTREGVIMGTPEYMAPEQLFSAETVDHRADLYSLGVILFEMLSGLRPTDGDDVEKIVAAVVAGNVRRLGRVEPGLPPGLVAVVERALAPERDARFGTALEMRLALAQFAGALSHAGQAAANAQPAVPGSPSNHPPQLHTAPLQAFDAAPAGVPKTVPPDIDPGGIELKGSTQEVSDDAMREAIRQSALPGQMPPAGYGYAPQPQQPYPPTNYAQQATEPVRRRSRSGLWVVVSLLVILLLGGVALGAVFYQQHQPSTDDAPLITETAVPQTTVSPLIPTSQTTVTPTQPVPPIATVATVGRPTQTVPTGTPTIVRPTDAGVPLPTPPTADAGRNTLPFPFPLPSTLPPLPSNFPPLPTSFPTTFPTTLPTGFPQIPGLTVPKQAAPDAGK